MTTTTIPENNAPMIAISAVNYRAFNFVLRLGIVGIIILGTIYILLINSLATRGFELEAIKNERIAIQKELEKADIASTIPTSLYALRSSEIVQEMPEIGKQKFLKVMEGQVAIK
jgi:uncharacterized membrane protein (DUF106 family)